MRGGQTCAMKHGLEDFLEFFDWGLREGFFGVSQGGLGLPGAQCLQKGIQALQIPIQAVRSRLRTPHFGQTNVRAEQEGRVGCG